MKVDGNIVYTLSGSEEVQNMEFVSLGTLASGTHSLAFETDQAVSGNLSQYFLIDNVNITSESNLITQNCVDDTDPRYPMSFQGQRHDDEIKGEGNSIEYKYRMHDPRLGRFFAVDPLTKKFPQWSPYQFGGNQVISSEELEGAEPEKDLNVNVSVSVNLGSGNSSSVSASIGVGMSFKGKNIMGALNTSARFYAGGLGSLGAKDPQFDLTASPSLTVGTGSAGSQPLTTFNSSTNYAVNNNFKYSITAATNLNLNFGRENNLASNLPGSFQRVGGINARAGDFSLSTYNDVFPLIGDGDDRYWTGGGSVFIGQRESFNLTLGTEVFTGERFSKDGNSNSGNYSSYNSRGSDLQTHPYYGTLNNKYTNGHTFLKISNGQYSANVGLSGVGKFDSMYSQNLIHDNFPSGTLPRFYSNYKQAVQIGGGLNY